MSLESERRGLTPPDRRDTPGGSLGGVAMSSEDPFALFITWTTYGTWLPGDTRGYVSNTLLPGGGWRPKENRPGTPYTADDAFTRERAQELQKWPTVWLTVAEATTVAHSRVRAARERGWRIVRGAIMANHVHVVIADCPDDGPGVRRILKGNSQADLSDAAGATRRSWTQCGSDRYLHDDRSIEGAIQYVAQQKGKLAEIIDMEVVPRASGGA